MALFQFKPEFGASIAKKPRVSRTQFGDGYAQLTRKGINTNPESWDLSFNNRTDIEADEIMAFLDEKAGSSPFEWNNGTKTLRFTCEDYSRTYDSENSNSIRAKFVEFYG